MDFINQFLTDEDTQELARLVKEVVNDPSTYQGSAYIPAIARPVREILTEVIEATGGMTNEHVPGTDPKYIQTFGTRTTSFIPPKYKEAVHYDEDKILFLRQLGDNGRNKRGVRQYINETVDQLNRRLEARIEKLRWEAIFDGGFDYFGKTFSYGIPAGNNAVPLGADWSTDGINANNSANPLLDIRHWTLGGLPQFRKYRISKMVMNPNTARWILDNENVISRVQNYYASDTFGAYELNKTLQMTIPGAPEAIVYDGWFQNETLVDGKIQVSDAVYFIPDGKIYFEVANLPGGDRIGEFVETVHLAEGTIDSPGFGKFLVIDDNTGPGTKGGPKNPYLDLVSGVYGGVNLYRPFDVLTATVYSE